MNVESPESATITPPPAISPASMAPSPTRHPLPPLTLFSVLVEVGLIVVALMLFARTYQDFTPTLRPQGTHWIFLTASGGYTQKISERTGAIPLWNPFVGTGEPMIEGLLSFVLNPLMLIPILWGGVVTGGKVAILLHIALMAGGGWLLGRLTRMRAPGRVMLALLLAGHGGWVAAVGEGHFQNGLSQAYIPWIFAGLLGTLYLRRRWPIVLLVVATALMLFAGSFWHVLPTAITCGLMAHIGVWDWRQGRLWLNPKALLRLCAAAVMIALLSAIRLLPQGNASQYTLRPTEQLIDFYDWSQVAEVYFAPTAGVVGTSYWLRYAYVFPSLIAAFLAALWLLVPGKHPANQFVVKVAIAAILGVLLYTWWAMGASSGFVWLYTQFPVLGNWRRMGRLAAAASPLIALLIALIFDAVVMRLYTLTRQREPLTIAWRWPRRNWRLPIGVAPALLMLTLVVGAFASTDVLNNWQRVAGLSPVKTQHGRFEGITFLRLLFPTKFLSIYTLDMATSIEFFDTLSRTLTGNPEIVVAVSAPSTGIGRFLAQPSEFVAGDNIGFLQDLAGAGYVPVPLSPADDGVAWAWTHPEALGYAFVVNRQLLEVPGRMRRTETQLIDTYTHNIDDIFLRVERHLPREMLVIHETAYPGWVVSVNGADAQTEVVGGRLAVSLPATLGPTDVKFSYRPTILYVGAAISGVGFALVVLFVFRGDRWLRRAVRQRLFHA